jgi:ABC-2 type transport system permease protein
MKLFSIEFKKIIAYPTFWVFIGFYMLMVILVFCSIPYIAFKGPLSVLTFKSYYTFPDIWHTLTYLAGIFNLLLGVLVIILITNEFTFRTLRQNIIDGWSITNFLSAKIILLLFLALCTTIFLFLFGLIYGFIKSPPVNTSSVFAQSNFILAYFVQALAYLCFALFIGTLFKKTGIGIIFFLLYSKIAEPLIGWKLPNTISDYLPFHNISQLIDFPAVKLGSITIYNSDSPLGIHFFFTILYSIIFLIGTYLLFTKRDN